MKITLKSLLLENFKGVESSAISFDNASVDIYGDNATGKTTHLDAFIWCLFNKDSLNSANFEIKALNTTGEPAHNLTHSVTTVLDIDGVILTLTKSMTERWTRRRGEKSKEFTGHTTTYFIDEVPAKKKEYDARITDTIDESAFRLLTDARYFNEQITWKDRRDLLMAICGDVSVDDIISANPDLKTVPEILKGKSPEDARKRLNGKRKAVNDELKAVPIRIDEATKSIVALAMPVKDAEGGLKALETERLALEREKAALVNSGEAAKLQVELQGIRAEIQKKKNDFEFSRSTRIKTSQEQLTYLETGLRTKQKDQDGLARVIDRNAAGITNVNDKLEKLRAEWYAVNDMAFDGSDTCPTCGQALPKDQVEAAIEKFNLSKAEMLKSVNSRGKVHKKTLADLEASVETTAAQAKTIIGALEVITESMAPIKAEIDKINAEECDTSELTKKVRKLEKRIGEAKAGENNDALSKLAYDLKENSNQTDVRKSVIAQAKANVATETRIKDLAGSEEELVGVLTGIEKDLYLIDEFTRVRVDLLESRINGKFQIARFKLFADQINGGLQDICETTLDGVPYGSMNSAGRVQVGMDIISTLQAHYKVSCPIWIDNRESIVELPEIDTQVISLIVSEKDKAIRVELVEHKTEVAA